MINYDYNILISLFSLPSKLKLFLSDNREEIFNTILPDKDNLLIHINKLLSMNLIYYKSNNTLTSDDTLYLSEEGGKLLEKKLNIDWKEYIFEEVSYFSKDTYQVTIQSNNLNKMYTTLTFLPKRYKNIKIKKITPWYPVYWKELPNAYEISVSIPEDYYIQNLQNNKKYLNLVHFFYTGFPSI